MKTHVRSEDISGPSKRRLLFNSQTGGCLDDTHAQTSRKYDWIEHERRPSKMFGLGSEKVRVLS